MPANRLPIRDRIAALVEGFRPYDELEQLTKADTLAWLGSDVEIFRIRKPDVPPKHLVSYVAIIDRKNEKILLMQHRKSGLNLPIGGHAEPGEDLFVTAQREAQEEVNLSISFLWSQPIFLSHNLTVNIDAGHTDVCFWYVAEASADQPIVFDPEEFTGYRWLSYSQVLAGPVEQFDRAFHRFMRKLMDLLAE